MSRRIFIASIRKSISNILGGLGGEKGFSSRVENARLEINFILRSNEILCEILLSREKRSRKKK